MNGLLDRRVIEALYAASQAGVEIDLIIRGMCSLRPGVKGFSERIRVRSIVGRFLEHSRIFSFANGGEEEVYCGSADWMPRNLIERCEVVFPVKHPELAKRLRHEILGAYLKDNVKARLLQPSGEYVRAPQAEVLFSAQDSLMAIAHGTEAGGKTVVEGSPSAKPATKTAKKVRAMTESEVEAHSADSVEAAAVSA
jgi:polyphosphate kinase